MRTSTVNGVTFKCPPYLVRAGSGWQVRLPGQQTVYFADLKCGSTRRAHRQALAHLEAQRPAVRSPKAEQATKLRRTGHPGLLLMHKPGNGKRRAAAEFQIRVPGQPIRAIYIGTEQTYEANYERKLAIALSEVDAKRKAAARIGKQRQAATR